MIEAAAFFVLLTLALIGAGAFLLGGAQRLEAFLRRRADRAAAETDNVTQLNRGR